MGITKYICICFYIKVCKPLSSSPMSCQDWNHIIISLSTYHSALKPITNLKGKDTICLYFQVFFLKFIFFPARELVFSIGRPKGWRSVHKCGRLILVFFLVQPSLHICRIKNQIEVFYKKKSAGFELEVLLDSPDFEECVGHCDGPFPLHELRARLPTLALDVVCFCGKLSPRGLKAIVVI